MIRYKYLFTVFIILVLSFVFSGCTQADNRPLFQRFGNGIDTISAEGLSDIWNMTGNLSGGNVTVVESFYNEDSIWVGLRIEGKELIYNHVYTSFYCNGEQIGAGSHGGSLAIDTENWIEETVRQPPTLEDISLLPDEFTLELVVGDLKFQDRTTTFRIPLKRSGRKVVRP